MPCSNEALSEKQGENKSLATTITITRWGSARNDIPRKLRGVGMSDEEHGDPTEQQPFLKKLANLFRKTPPSPGNDEYADEEWFGVGGVSFSPDMHEEG